MLFIGQDVADNLMNLVVVPSPILVEVSPIQVVGITPFGSYIESICGLNVGAPFPPDFASRIGLPPTPPPTTKPKNPLDQSDFMVGSFVEKIKVPLSKGHLELRNLDPNDNPKVRFNYFKEPKDLQRCIRGLKVMKRVVESKALSKLISIQFCLLLGPPQHCREAVRTIWHYHGGCVVGKVVDHDYKVLSVDALRVIDGSTFHNAPGINPQATFMTLGRYIYGSQNTK